MKRIMVAVLGIIVALSTSSCGMKTVQPGWEGIRVNLVGGNRGVEELPIVTGRVWFNPFTEAVYEYPTFKQNYIWTTSSDEGSRADESITFNAEGGISVNADVGIVYNVKPGMTPKLFNTYRQDIEKLTDGVVRNEVRDALNQRASKMNVMDLIGGGKGELLAGVREDLQKGPLGAYIDFETISFVHALRLPANVQESINLVVQSMNAAKSAEAAVKTKEAEAQQAIAAAEGRAQALRIEAEGQAQANRILNSSLTPTLVEWSKVQKWNGVQPQVVGSGVGILVAK